MACVGNVHRPTCANWRGREERQERARGAFGNGRGVWSCGHAAMRKMQQCENATTQATISTAQREKLWRCKNHDRTANEDHVYHPADYRLPAHATELATNCEICTSVERTVKRMPTFLVESVLRLTMANTCIPPPC